MLFNSLQYLVFLPLVAITFFILPHRFRWVLILLASYYFYMCWKPAYLVVILLSTFVGYVAGIKIADAGSQKKKRLYLGLSLAVNLGLLFFFKYFNFANNSVRLFAHYLNLPYDVPALNVLLPVGISFHTFQIIGYNIDVFRGSVQPERRKGYFSLFGTFFPQLVAGPIERARNLLPQLLTEQRFDEHRISSGLRLILWGLFKKMVIADRLAGYTNMVYGSPSDYSNLGLLVATYFFSFQIYCDFSGYSDIAVGSARILGFNLMRNFRSPYFAASIPEFWQRWHISLSTWFRDYVYVSLGGNRVSRWKWWRNILIVFGVSGLWHGANWTFAVWGLLHGMLYLFSTWTQTIQVRIANALRLDRLPTLSRFLAAIWTFHLVALTWIFFRAGSISDAFSIVSRIAGGIDMDWTALGLSGQDMFLAVAGIAVLVGVELLQSAGSLGRILQKGPALRWAIYAVLALALLNLRVLEPAPFIYFQF